ncbi:hypothetical protein FOZ61_010547 [Perkinsus olseni]|uniref:Amine oxidase n=1 Tax=Perkinsus olseni TaxID=32597 RepID=A0A7J6M3I7_PEROL|nr:hypothetical protein FOZ61_010547 [Perkinsus olseni]
MRRLLHLLILSILPASNRGEEVLDLAIVIPTAPTQTQRRCTVRDSWARQLADVRERGKRKVKLYFVVGDTTELAPGERTSLETEKAQYGDIHELTGFKDGYSRLGLKVIETFKVAQQLFGKFRLLLKTDTDSYVHVQRLISALDEKGAFELARVYAGEFWWGLPILQESLKSSTGLKDYPVNARGAFLGEAHHFSRPADVFGKPISWVRFDHEISRAGYVLSFDLVQFLAEAALPFKEIEAEDAMIGTYLAPFEFTRIDYDVSPMTPQCGCAITCEKNNWDTAGKVYQVDHYNTFETLRWKQRRYEMFGDSCWRMGSPQESSCRRATLPAGGGQKFYFDAITTAMIPDGVVVPDHTSTRDGVCKISFQWKADGWSGCSKECGGGVRTRCIKCSGPNGHAYDDVECDANTRPSEEEPCNDHPCPEGAFLATTPISTTTVGAETLGASTSLTGGVSGLIKDSASSRFISGRGPPLLVFFIISLSVALLPMCSSDHHPASTAFDVIIIGGGAAGLAAARALQGLYNVAVIEARPRLGGRISPTKWHRGVAIDMGAQYIHGVCPENPMVDLVNRGKLNLEEYPGSDEEYITALRAYSSQGRLYSAEELNSAYKRMQNLMEKVEKVCRELDDDVSLEEGVRLAGVVLSAEDELVRYLWWYLVHTWMGVSSDAQLRANEFDGSDETGRCDGPDGKVVEGMYALVEELEKECPHAHFVLSTPVVSVEQGGDASVTVTARDGAEYFARACICTVPLGVLQQGRLRFVPELPSAQRESIGRLGTGTSEKVFLGWDKVDPIPDDKEGIAVIGPGGQNWLFEVLSGNAVTAQVVDISGAEAIDGAVQALRIAIPDLPPPDQTGITFFCSGLYSMGAYSHYRPGATEKDVEAAAQRHGLVWFAGEHCDPEYQGAVHAALLTGAKAAEDVEEYLTGRPC